MAADAKTDWQSVLDTAQTLTHKQAGRMLLRLTQSQSYILRHTQTHAEAYIQKALSTKSGIGHTHSPTDFSLGYLAKY